MAPQLLPVVAPEEYWEATGEFSEIWTFSGQGVELIFSGDQPKGPKSLRSIYIDGPCKLQTSRGVGLGATEAQTASTYQDLLFDVMTDPSYQFVAGDESTQLFFSIENGVVSSIFLGPGPE